MKALYFILITLNFSCRIIPATSNVFLKSEIDSYGLRNGDTLVDIGCGDGLHSTFVSHFYPNSYFVLEDLDTSKVGQIANSKTEFYKYIRERHIVVLGKSDSIPLLSLSYKFLLCRKTLHEFTNKSKMIQEMNRILVASGRLIIVEVEPINEGEVDSYCKKVLMTKEIIIDLVERENFIFLNAAEIKVKKDRKLAVLIFEKL